MDLRLHTCYAASAAALLVGILSADAVERARLERPLLDCSRPCHAVSDASCAHAPGARRPAHCTAEAARTDD
jgi:hypothetical protein